MESGPTVRRKTWEDQLELVLTGIGVLALAGYAVWMLFEWPLLRWAALMPGALALVGVAVFWRQLSGEVDRPARLELAAWVAFYIANLCVMAMVARRNSYGGVVWPLAIATVVVIGLQVRAYRRRHLPRRVWWGSARRAEAPSDTPSH